VTVTQPSASTTPHPARGVGAVASIRPAAWWDAARCRGTDAALFFPPEEDGEDVRDATAICSGCPVARECLEWALDTDEQFGVWGGTTPRERRRLKRLRRKSA
jgi:WhiB family redox-sensing transcriptional regulator